MIHPNRTYLLQQKERRKTVSDSLDIIQARRQALIVEFFATARPFIMNRQQISSEYRRAIEELQLTRGMEGQALVASVAAISQEKIEVNIQPRNILGIRYKEASVSGEIRGDTQDFLYDTGLTPPSLEEASNKFRLVLENMLKIAGFESKLKRLARDIRQLTRKSRVLERKVLPELAANLRTASQYIAEREREDHFRLKKFKELKQGRS